MQNKRKLPNKGSKPKSIHELVYTSIRALGKDASLKTLFPKLLRNVSQEHINKSLKHLEEIGKIKLLPKGFIKVLEEDLNVKKKFITGTVDLTQSGAAYIISDEMKDDVFVPAKSVMNALKGDLVKVNITKFAKRRPEGVIVEIIKRSRDSFAGRIELKPNFAFFMANENLGFDVFVPLTKTHGAKNNDLVIVKITEWNNLNKNPVGEVIEILDETKKADLDMKLILLQNGFNIEFPEKVIQEVNAIRDEITDKEIAKRLDLRETLTFTIDPDDAKDFDDAVSIRKLENGHWEIGVHIADVSHYVRENTALDKEAEHRGTSVYLPDRVCPMLPERLSNNICSLRPNEDKLTFSTIFEFDQKHHVSHYTIAKTVIHSNRRFTYDEVQTILEAGEGEYVAELTLLNSISKTIRQKRTDNGAIAFEKEEVKFKLDENGKPIGVYTKVRKDAHLLIEDFMLLANETVAKFGAKLEHSKNPYPFVYRIHDNPDPTKLEQLSMAAARFGYSVRFTDPQQTSGAMNALLKKVQGRPEQNVMESMAIRSMAKAAYTIKNIGHYGLAMEYYSHFTSPIRRYPDILAHRILEMMLDKTHDVLIDKEHIEEMCKNSSMMERKAMDAEREAIKYKQVEYLQDKLGTEWDGVITGVIARGIFVEIIENKCEGMIPLDALGDELFVYDEQNVCLTGKESKTKFSMGDKLRIKVAGADILTKRIEFLLV